MHMNEFHIALRTGPRSVDYLHATMANLERAGVFASQVPWRMVVTDSGDQGGFVRQYAPDRIVYQQTRAIPNLNGAAAILHAAALGVGWVLFLEDDIDVCDDFLESVNAWINDVVDAKYRVYSLCANYVELEDCDGPKWDYPVAKFYGSQALALRSGDAASFGAYVVARQATWLSPKKFDILLKEWHLKTYPPLENMAASFPNMVQHMGRVSSVHTDGPFHEYWTWPGPDWSYYRSRSNNSIWPRAASKQTKVSDLADALIEALDKSRPVYDMGCNRGYYIDRLTNAGFDCWGFEGTPGMNHPRIKTADLTEPLPHPEKRGTVLCLEVAEHIPSAREDAFLKNLCDYCDGTLVLSWAVPGQGGIGHTNERPMEYVVHKIQGLGFDYDEATTRSIRSRQGYMKWFRGSLYVFRRRAGA